MFFKSKNRKLVERWEKEHVQLLSLAKAIIGKYIEHEHDEAKKLLKKFSTLAMNHISSEDLEFMEILRDPDRKDRNIEAGIRKFKNSFSQTKETLMDFLTHYNDPDVKLDKEFYEQFKGIAKVLEDRIDFEESNLYTALRLS